MTKATQGFMVAALLLFAAAPLRAQAGGSSAAHSTTQTADTAAGHGGHHHHHGGGGRHAGGHKTLSFDSTTNTATFTLVSGRPRGPSRLTFNGHANGTATLVVPPGSHVAMHFVNEDSIPHSAVVIPDREPMPMRLEPAIPGAATKDLTQGVPPNGTDTVRFTAPASGSYRIVSGVSGQARAGMWIRLRVDPTARTPRWDKHT
jgi:plastocyanin